MLQGTGPLAAVTGFESPLHSGRSVVAHATDKEAMGLLSQSLNDAGKIKSLRGDLGLMRGDAIESTASSRCTWATCRGVAPCGSTCTATPCCCRWRASPPAFC